MALVTTVPTSSYGGTQKVSTAEMVLQYTQAAFGAWSRYAEIRSLDKAERRDKLDARAVERARKDDIKRLELKNAAAVNAAAASPFSGNAVSSGAGNGSIILLAGLAAVAGFFFLRKRR